MSRRKGRYERRQQKRLAKRIERSRNLGSLAEIFNFHDTFNYGRKCCNGVRWKNSVQRFEQHLFSGTASRIKAVLEGNYVWHKYKSFMPKIKGADKVIDAPHITDRQIHKVLSKKILFPLYYPSMIWNNGASIKGKGMKFTRHELVKDLQRHYKKYGLNGYIILIDFKKFFPSADEEYIHQRHKKFIFRRSVLKFVDSLLDTLDKNKGAPLGVEPFQMEMVSYPSMLDNYVKCQLSIKGAGHYMDDYYLLIPPDKNPTEILRKFAAKAKENKINLNTNKTKIIPIHKNFRFCKFKYSFTNKGTVRVNAGKATIRKFNRKIRCLWPKFLSSKLTLLDLWSAVQSIKAYYSRTDDHGLVLTLYRKFYKNYGFSCENYWGTKEMEYITHNRYKGKTMEDNEILIRRGDKLVRKGDILYFKDTPVCIHRSLVGKQHFAKNDDGLGMERGDLTYLLAYSNRVRYADDNPEHTQRFTDYEIEKLKNNWNQYLKPNIDALLFNDQFFEEKPEILKNIIEDIDFNENNE